MLFNSYLWILFWATNVIIYSTTANTVIASDKPLNFLHAYDICRRAHGGHLVSPDTEAEDDIFIQVPMQDRNVWLGGYRTKKEWHWTNGDPFDSNNCSMKQKFILNQPKIIKGTKDVLSVCNGNCVGSFYPYLVMDISVDTNTTKCYCPTVSYVYNNNFGFLCEEDCIIKIGDTETSCKSLKSSKIFFIGNTFVNENNQDWSPVEVNMQAECAVVWIIRPKIDNQVQPYLLLRRTNCSGMYPYICGKQMASANTNKVEASPKFKSWTEARDACMGMGRDLLKVDDEVTRILFENEDKVIEDKTPYWVGLTLLNWQTFQTRTGRFQYIQHDILPDTQQNLSCLVLKPNGTRGLANCCEPTNNVACTTDTSTDERGQIIKAQSVDDLDKDVREVCGNITYPSYTTTTTATTGSVNMPASDSRKDNPKGRPLTLIVVCTVVGGVILIVLILITIFIVVRKKNKLKDAINSADNKAYDKDNDADGPPPYPEPEQPYAVFSNTKPADKGNPGSNRESGVPIVDNDLYTTNQPPIQNDVYAEVNKPKKPNQPHPQTHPNPKAQTARKPGSETYELAGPGFDHNAGRRDGPSTGVVRPHNPQAYEDVPGFKDI